MEKGLQKLFRAHFLGAHIIQTAPKYIWMWHCTVPEIQSETDKIVCHLGCFLPFYAPPSSNDPKNQNFEKKKMKKCLVILPFSTYMCTINKDHMIYGT